MNDNDQLLSRLAIIIKRNGGAISIAKTNGDDMKTTVYTVNSKFEPIKCE